MRARDQTKIRDTMERCPACARCKYAVRMQGGGVNHRLGWVMRY